MNAEGHLEAVLAVCRNDTWSVLWDDLDVKVLDFEALGLDRDMADDSLWGFCQSKDIVLVTSNRNSDGPTSLQATIVRLGNEQSLPVFTFADSDRVRSDRTYSERVAVKLMEFLMDLDRLRGAGRLWLP